MSGMAVVSCKNGRAPEILSLMLKAMKHRAENGFGYASTKTILKSASLNKIMKRKTKNCIGYCFTKTCPLDEIQPIEYIIANNIPFIEGSIIKYISRHRYKNHVEDLKKAKHMIEILAESEYGEII